MSKLNPAPIEAKEITVEAKGKEVTVELPLHIEWGENPAHVQCYTDDGTEVFYFTQEEQASIGIIAQHIKNAYENPESVVNDWAAHIVSDYTHTNP